METVTLHEPNTRTKYSRQTLPVIVPLNKSQMDYRKRAGIIGAEDGYFYEDVAKTVPVRLVSEALGTLGTSDDKWRAFEAKYGFTIREPERRNVFFTLMLAKAVEGRDPNRGVREALRYYRGDQPQGLFRAGGSVSQGIQREPLRTILEMLNAGLKGARPVVWWSFAKRKASLGLYCPDGQTALYALALEGLGSLGGVGVCQRCGNPFHRSRRTQRYCSHRCQLAASMRRFRLRHASKYRRNKPKNAHGRIGRPKR
jgi:hypothetical protein